ncbi:MAG: UTP--glucose-1-phosphate uridylyltransferase GalU [bacterium]
MAYTKIRKCLFPAAGYGTRFLPATKAMPKEILPILNKPLIQYGVEEALAAGMRQIAFVTGRTKRAIEDHFDVNYEMEHEIEGTPAEASLLGIRRLINECTFSYTRQTKMKGLGHAVLTGETLIGREPFGVILADDLCITEDGEGILVKMAKVFEKTGCSVLAVQKVKRKDLSKYGVIEFDPSEADSKAPFFRIKDLIEKPSESGAPSDMAVIGRYILKPSIFDELAKAQPGLNGEIQLTDALRAEAKKGELMAYRFTGRRFDCGTVEGFVDATEYFYRLLKGDHL